MSWVSGASERSNAAFVFRRMRRVEPSEDRRERTRQRRHRRGIVPDVRVVTRFPVHEIGDHDDGARRRCRSRRELCGPRE
jgi:hypothetical protein